MPADPDVLRLPAEVEFKDELAALATADRDPRPENWRLSPKAVLTYVMGGDAGGTPISPKYIGPRRLVEIAVATLLTDRALLLMGEPGTAKSWLSEHLAAAVHGDSGKVVQGTMGTTEEQVKYTWNYALLIAEGPSPKALVKTPVFRAMEDGGLVRFEEITRCASEVQDALISVLSEKCIAIPELDRTVRAARGFGVVATANTRDRGVNDMSAALKRRFNMVILPPPATPELECEIVATRVERLARTLRLAAEPPAEEAVRQVVTVFRELRAGRTEDGRERLKSPGGTLSTAEAISLLVNGMALAAGFGDGTVGAADLAAGLVGAVVKDEDKDRAVLREYLDNVMRKRGAAWRPLHQHCRDLLG